MREYKFRGKRVDNGERVYGYFLKDIDGKAYIVTEDMGWVSCCSDCGMSCMTKYEVDPETVGQYTELKDKAGKEIYEDDLLHVLEVSNTATVEYTSRVEYIESGFVVTAPNDTQVPLACFHGIDTYPLFEIKVVGNINDNPEVLKAG